MNLELFDDHIAISPIGGQDRSHGGIVIPETAQEKPWRGRVLAVGPGRMLEDGSRLPMPVKVGDIVIYGKHGGIEQKVGDTELVFIQARFLFGRVESRES